MSANNDSNRSHGSPAATYVVGIDLGTTHTALAYAKIPDAEASGKHDAKGDANALHVLQVPQLVAAGTLDARPLLPSFLYLAHESEGALALPWDATRSYAVGEFARARAIDAPARVVQSAKSWLCHPRVDRRANILPHGAPDDVAKVSPVEASVRYLKHLAEAWENQVQNGDPALSLRHQSIVLTVPASFDAAARELTTEAAFAAGFTDLTLLEEPQAALYAWLAAKGDAWRKEIAVGDVILVVDVGGGTTDFSVIVALESEGQLALERVTTGEHILLGGDNMDLLLAHIAEQKMLATAEAAGKTLELDRFQKVALQHAARAAKEALLSVPSKEAAQIAIAGKGTKLVGSTLRTELVRADVGGAIVDGFFPVVESSARPAVRPRTGLVELGLPYAQDPAVTRHLAALLGPKSGERVYPTRILFNGGVMKSDALRERVAACVTSWAADGAAADGTSGSAASNAKAPRVLDGMDLDLAVAKGAAAYGLARRGKGVRIRGGTARAYYVGIEGAAPAIPGLPPPLTALCVAPLGMEEGTQKDITAHLLGVVVGEEVRFRFFGSQSRKSDVAGTTLERWKPEDLSELSPVAITLPAEGRAPGDVVPVTIRSTITEVGTLLLEAIPTDDVAASRGRSEHWKIELSVREKE